jgi:hypothetical protein
MRMPMPSSSGQVARIGFTGRIVAGYGAARRRRT